MSKRINFILLILLFLYSFYNFCSFVTSPKCFYTHKMDINDLWKLIDKSVGVGENFLEFMNFCKKKIPPYANVLFFVPYTYYKKKFVFSYLPHRAKFYLYPIKVWWFKDKYKKIIVLWKHLDITSKRLILKNVEYVIGFKIKEKDFPGFFKYAEYKEGTILKKWKY